MRSPRTTGSNGFTLLELMVVLGVIALVVAIAAPNLLPLVTYFGHEGAARELASYGESAMRYARLNSKEIIVVFDLEENAYWVEHWVDEEEDNEGGYFATEASEEETSIDGEDEAVDGEEMTQRIDEVTDRKLYAQAMLVEHHKRAEEESDEGLFGKPKPRRTRADREVLQAELLGRRELPEEIFMHSISLPDDRASSGKIDLIIPPLGIEQEIRIDVSDEDGNMLQVRWDPILARGFVHEASGR